MTVEPPVEPPVEPLSNLVCAPPLYPRQATQPARHVAGGCLLGERSWLKKKRTTSRAGAARARRCVGAPRDRHAKASAASCGCFSPILKRISHARPTRLDMGWRASCGCSLATSACWRALSRIEPGRHSGVSVCRVDITDMVNLSRAKDAAVSLVLGVLNQYWEAA